MSSQTFCTSCFKSLGVPTRMEIFRYLADKKSASVNDIVEKIGLTQPTISYHLHEMQEKGILESEKRGKEVYYSISTTCPHSSHECVLKKISSNIENHA